MVIICIKISKGVKNLIRHLAKQKDHIMATNLSCNRNATNTCNLLFAFKFSFLLSNEGFIKSLCMTKKF